MGRIVETSSEQFCYIDGTLIDFNKIVGISDPEFLDEMGYGGYFCAYSLLTISGERVVFKRELTGEEYGFKGMSFGFELYSDSNSGDLFCMINERNHCNKISRLWMKSQKTT